MAPLSRVVIVLRGSVSLGMGPRDDIIVHTQDYSLTDDCMC
jgi:hypothetical protein